VTENAYLVGLRLAGKKVVVVGGGTVAQRRLPLLVSSGADVHVITTSATPAVEAIDGITMTIREFRDGDLAGAWYAIAATDDPDVNAAIVAEAESRHVFCVRADVAVEGTAVTPASFEYEGLAVGVLAAGEHRRDQSVGIQRLLCADIGQQQVLDDVHQRADDHDADGYAGFGGRRVVVVERDDHGSARPGQRDAARRSAGERMVVRLDLIARGVVVVADDDLQRCGKYVPHAPTLMGTFLIS